MIMAMVGAMMRRADRKLLRDNRHIIGMDVARLRKLRQQERENEDETRKEPTFHCLLNVCSKHGAAFNVTL